MRKQEALPPGAILIPDDAACVFKGEIFDVYQWPQELFDGSMATFEMLRRPDTVLFLAIKDDKILFIRERQPNRDEHVRLPGGRVDAGEMWLTAAQRECKEELGLEFKNWRLVEVRQPVAKIEWLVALYVATDCIGEGATQHDPGEMITVVPMTCNEAKEHFASVADSFNSDGHMIFEAVNSLDDIRAFPEFKGERLHTEV